MSDSFNLPSLYENRSSNRCIIIAHRGASAYYPENTMPAFEAALGLGAEMIELDVMLSKDKVPVVFHDARLNSHTNGKGLVEERTLQELKELDAGSWFDSEFSGICIPTLEEVLNFASEQVALNIEIKPEAVTVEEREGIEEKCLRLVEEYEMERYVLFSSFDYRAVSRIKRMAPQVATALLYNRRLSGKKLPHELVKENKADAFNCNYYQLTRQRLSNLKEHQIPFFIYTINRKRKMKKLLQKGVTGIFTNKPDLLRELILEG